MDMLQIGASKKTVAISLAVAALLLGAGLLWQSRLKAAQIVLVEVASIGDVTRLLAVNGKIAPLRAVAIRVASTSTVVQVMAQEGDVVAQGAVLVVLDAGLQIASVVQAQTALAQGRSQAAAASAEYKRDAKLGLFISPTALENSRQQAEGAAQDVLRLDALLAQAKIQLSRYSLKAPMAGTVLSRNVELGQLVDPSSTLMTLADLSALVVEATVDETYASQIKQGQTVMLQLIGTREVLAGKVAFVAPQVDAATGGLAMKLAFDVPIGAAVGLTVTANIVVDQRRAITVAHSALRGEAVFLLQNGMAHLTKITAIEWPADRLIVTKGLKAGDTVIVAGDGISEGQKLTASTAVLP